MGLLDFDDHYVPPFTPSRSKINEAKDRRAGILKDNFQELQNMGHREMSEDFEDSPHADRKPLTEETD